MITIVNAQNMTKHMAVYWNRKARDLNGRVDVIDPWRFVMKDLRKVFRSGLKVYRASTGGRWGKSSSIEVL